MFHTPSRRAKAAVRRSSIIQSQPTRSTKGYANICPNCSDDCFRNGRSKSVVIADRISIQAETLSYISTCFVAYGWLEDVIQ